MPPMTMSGKIHKIKDGMKKIQAQAYCSVITFDLNSFHSLFNPFNTVFPAETYGTCQLSDTT